MEAKIKMKMEKRPNYLRLTNWLSCFEVAAKSATNDKHNKWLLCVFLSLTRFCVITSNRNNTNSSRATLKKTKLASVTEAGSEASDDSWKWAKCAIKLTHSGQKTREMERREDPIDLDLYNILPKGVNAGRKRRIVYADSGLGWPSSRHLR